MFYPAKSSSSPSCVHSSRPAHADPIAQSLSKSVDDGGSKSIGRDHQSKENRNAPGFFYNARHFAVYKPILVDNSPPELETVFDCLRPEIIPEAALNSSARGPPPRCHPGTRKQLNEKLDSWLADQHRQWNMIWLRGPAGTGKSAVAQTFAEHAVEQGLFGAAFFFSRPNKRHNPRSVFPTLAYQLATRNSGYKTLLNRQLVDNPLVRLGGATLRVQFKKLILEPFLTLMPYFRRSLLIVLDGLDECKGEDAQCEIIKLVCEAANRSNNLPLLWLVCSRPEPHITFTFSTLESSINCRREQLILDAETRDDVDKYLRDSLAQLRAKYQDVLPLDVGQSWPSEAEFTKISGAASGLFVFASTALKYIGDPEYADPGSQLRHLLRFIDTTELAGVKTPWDTLDELYTRILSDIPKHILPITMRILKFCVASQNFFSQFSPPSAQRVCVFLRLERNTFLAALRKLHAVMSIPPPEEADEEFLTFHHASFRDYLQSPTRSEKYFVDARTARADLVKCSLDWYSFRPGTIDFACWSDSCAFASDLTWVFPGEKIANLHYSVARMACVYLANACRLAAARKNPDIFFQLSKVYFTDFTAGAMSYFVRDFANAVYESCPGELGQSIIRAQVGDSDFDTQNLDYLASLVGPNIVLRPASFPIRMIGMGDLHLEYFFLGQKSNSCIVCFSEGKIRPRCHVLRAAEGLSEEEISEFRADMGIN